MIPFQKTCGILILALGVAGALGLATPREARADELKDGRAALQAGQLDDALRLFEKAASQGSIFRLAMQGITRSSYAT